VRVLALARLIAAATREQQAFLLLLEKRQGLNQK
jgi:hypothetical protein